jgi:hypothetical protein
MVTRAEVGRVKGGNALEKELDRLPRPLRALLDEEIASGNEIVEIGHSFPAPPVGLFVKLARPVTTRPHGSGEGIEYYERDSPDYSGEFNDPKRFFFILEPPHPLQLEQGKDAVLEAHGADRSQRFAAEEKRAFPTSETLLGRFQRSMVIDYEKWHDGTGYDLEALLQASPEERDAIENLLIGRTSGDWRDIEALAEMDSPRSRKFLRETFAAGDPNLRLAVISHAPDIVTFNEKVNAIVYALHELNIYGGLSQALDMVEDFHPPEVVNELFRGVQSREGEVAVNFAAMLLFVHGKADSPFDWTQRPFLLRFNTDNAKERRDAFLELCQKIGVKADVHEINMK